LAVIDVVAGIMGTILGGVLGHFLSVRQQKIEWRRQDQIELLHRENVERINFSVKVRFVVIQGEDWLVELAAIIDNKGTVRYVTSEFTFELRCLYPEDSLTPGGSEIGGQAYIPHVLTAGSWLPANWGATRIEPGLTARYSYVTSVPCRATAVLLHAAFRYEAAGDKNRHTAETLQAIPRNSED
jgi:hypothetical protein